MPDRDPAGPVQLDDLDRQLIEQLAADTADADADTRRRLVGLHRKILTEQQVRRRKLAEQLAAVDRSIALRQYALDLLAQDDDTGR